MTSVDAPWCVDDFECWHLLQSNESLGHILSECAKKRLAFAVPPDFALPVEITNAASLNICRVSHSPPAPGSKQVLTSASDNARNKVQAHAQDAHLLTFLRWHVLVPDRKIAGRYASLVNAQALLQIEASGLVTLDGPWPRVVPANDDSSAWPSVIGNERRALAGGGGGLSVQLLLLSMPLARCGPAEVLLPRSLVTPFGQAGHNVQDAVEFLTQLDDGTGSLVHAVTLGVNAFKQQIVNQSLRRKEDVVSGSSSSEIATPPRRTSGGRDDLGGVDEGEEERLFCAVDKLVESCVATVCKTTSQRRTVSIRRLQFAVALAVETLTHSLVFQRVFPLIARRCENDSLKLRRQVERLRRKGMTREELGADAALEAVDLRPARAALDMLGASTSPFEVVTAILRFVDTVVSCVPSPLHKYVTADSLVPLLQHTVAASPIALDSILSHVEYMSRFPSRLIQILDSEGEYKVVSFRIAVQALIQHHNGEMTPGSLSPPSSISKRSP